MLEIYVGGNFSFEFHINSISSKASQKLHALSRIVKYNCEDKKCVICFLNLSYFSQFNYCLIVWVCFGFGRGLNNKINGIHERALSIVYQEKKNQFSNFIETWQICVSSYKNHIFLASEVVQVKNEHSPEIMKEIFVFQENETYNLKSGSHLVRRNIWKTRYGIESVSNLGAIIRDLLPGQTKNSLLFCFQT